MDTSALQNESEVDASIFGWLRSSRVCSVILSILD